MPVLKLLNSHTIVFRQYQKKYCIIHIAFISSIASSNKYSEFNFILLFILLKLICKHDLKVPVSVTEVYIYYILQFHSNSIDTVYNRRLLLWKISLLLWPLVCKCAEMIPKYNLLLKALKNMSARDF